MIVNKAEVIDYLCNVIHKNMDYAVIGLSGGVDSTLAACICKLALGGDNVYTYGMPYKKTDWVKYNANSENIANCLNINYMTIPIYDVVEGYNDVFSIYFSQHNIGNLKTRIRTNILYTMNTHLNEITGKIGFVIGTSNLSEMFVGYNTKGGDALGDIFPLGDFYKSEIYDLADYMVVKKILKNSMIDRVPTAALIDGQTDEDDLGVNYDEIENVIRQWNQKKENYVLAEFMNRSFAHRIVMNKYFKSRHKHRSRAVIPMRRIIKN